MFCFKSAKDKFVTVKYGACKSSYGAKDPEFRIVCNLIEHHEAVLNERMFVTFNETFDELSIKKRFVVSDCYTLLSLQFFYDGFSVYLNFSR